MSNSAMKINRIISIVTLLMAIISVKAQLKFPGAQPVIGLQIQIPL